MKNIEKTVRKIIKLFQDENNEAWVIKKANSSLHVLNIMENDNQLLSDDENDSNFIKINLNENINQQLKLLITDSNIDSNLLISVVSDFTRKVFSKEMIKLVTAISDYTDLDLFSTDEKKII